MNAHLTLVAAAIVCCLCGCGSQDATAAGATGSSGGATGSSGSRLTGEEICKSDTLDALLTLNYWQPSGLRSRLQKKPATEPPGSPCAAMKQTCCKPELEMTIFKELVRPYYKQRCANATREGVGTSCWRTGRQIRRALYSIIVDGFKLLVAPLNDEMNATMNTTLPRDTFDGLVAYMAQFLFTSNICQLENATKATMQKLFDNIYQLQGGISLNSTTAQFQACYHHQSRDYLQPYNIKAFNDLENILNEYRLFNHALFLAEQVLHTIAGHMYPEECLRALTDLQHCAYCGGYSNPKPCLNFCLNTMRGCFANVAALKDDVSQLNVLMSSFTENIIVPQWQPNTLVDAHLNAFIISAQNMMKTNLTLMVYNSCINNMASNESGSVVNPNTTTSYRNARAVDMNSVTTVTGAGMAAAVLSNAIINDMKCISSVEGLLDTMPERVCSPSKNPLSSGANDYCWNGSNVGSYLIAPVGLSRDEQVNNPVFQLNISVPYQYQPLSNRIKSINSKLRIVLDCLVSDDEDCTTITNFYTCVDVPRDDQESGSGDSPGNGFDDIEDIDIERPTSSISQITPPSNQSATSGTGTRGSATRTNSSAPTTIWGSVATRLYNTSVGDMNITVDINDTTAPGNDITMGTNDEILGSMNKTDQLKNSCETLNFSARTVICLGLFHLLLLALDYLL